MKKNIAILSFAKDEVSETFIANHVKFIPHHNTHIFGSPIPRFIDEKKEHLPQKLFFNLLYGKKGNMIHQKNKLYHLLKEHKIEVVLAEYLHLGARIVNICKKANIPLIVTALGYDISEKETIEHHQKKYKLLFDYCKNIVIVSNHMRESLEALGCPKEKIVYSPIGADPDFYDLQPRFAHQNFVAVGRMVDKKAPHLTLLAFKEVVAQFPHAQLYFAGDGELMNVAQDIIKTYHLEENVKLLGYIDKTQQKELFENAIAFVQHSKTASNGDSEGTPVVILEASAAGLPVISTLHAGIPDVIIHQVTGLLCEEYDIEKMATHMIDLLKNPEKAKEMGEKGRTNVQNNFSLEQHIEILNHLILH